MWHALSQMTRKFSYQNIKIFILDLCREKIHVQDTKFEFYNGHTWVLWAPATQYRVNIMMIIFNFTAVVEMLSETQIVRLETDWYRRLVQLRICLLFWYFDIASIRPLALPASSIKTLFWVILLETFKFISWLWYFN